MQPATRAFAVSRHADTYRSYRRFWWLRPSVLLPTLFLVLLAVPMLLWIHTYGSAAADAMFAITYLSLAFWFIRFMKGNILEPHIRTDPKAVERARKDVEDGRRAYRAKIYAEEIARLKRGETTPVLAVWMLDPGLRSGHPLIGGLRVCHIDPAVRELQLRIHLDDTWTFGDGSADAQRLVDLRSGLLAHMIPHRDVKQLYGFFDTVVLEIYRPEDDGSLTGAPVPVMSCISALTELKAWCLRPAGTTLPGECRYARGGAIEPHRSIEVL